MPIKRLKMNIKILFTLFKYTTKATIKFNKRKNHEYSKY